MQRRSLLKLGLVSAAVLAVAGGAAVLVQSGLEGGKLTATGREVFAAVGNAVLDKTLPEDSAARQMALDCLLQRIDVLATSLPPHAQAELSQLLSVLGSSAGRQLLAGLGTSWAKAGIADVQQALQGMRLSSFTLRQQAYAALHDITAGAYFSDPSGWVVLGYPGPLKI